MPDLLEPTTPELIKEAERELALRQRVYPEWVKKGRLKQPLADRRIELMAAIVSALHRSQSQTEEIDRLRRAVAFARSTIKSIVSALHRSKSQTKEIDRLRRAVAFARSTIKSGEPWTETCEQELRL